MALSPEGDKKSQVREQYPATGYKQGMAWGTLHSTTKRGSIAHMSSHARFNVKAKTWRKTWQLKMSPMVGRARLPE